MNASSSLPKAGARSPEIQINSPPLRILVLDDVAFDRRRIIRACERAGVFARYFETASLSDFDGALQSGTFDLAFIDYRLPDSDGLMALARLQADPGQADCAAIMVAGDIDASVAIEALKGGCIDYIGKTEISPLTLQRAISGAVEKARLRRQNAAALVLLDALHATLERLADVAGSEARADLDALVSAAGGSGTDPAWRLRDFLDEIAAYAPSRTH